ncbi:MAG TPA: delta-60 repeat domain-containing protein, partial [Verrucomicrobiales bacterium]|nr:delta-60 repeat domain-containing protein [Verrucomicrobiales bacterium]
ILAGQFTTYGSANAGRIARVFADGSLDTTFNTGTGFGSTVNTLAFDAAGRIMVGGAFTIYRNTTVGRIAVLHTNGFTPSTPPLPSGDPFTEFLAAAGVPENKRGAGDDPDNDGIPNLMEYALDLNPLANSASSLPVVGATQTHLTLTYRRFRAGLTYSVQASPDLSTPAAWTSAGVNQGTPSADGITTASIPIGGTDRFLRLRVTFTP